MTHWETDLLAKYFTHEGFALIIGHGQSVADLAQKICGRVGVSDQESFFIEQAALLHDIGICRVKAPEIGMYGEHDYIMHGILGREILETEGLPLHALVCERHIGVGLTIADIESQGLPLPHRDMTPQSISEQIICFADLFFSKKTGAHTVRKSPERVRQKLLRFGEEKIQIFDNWMEQFWPF